MVFKVGVRAVVVSIQDSTWHKGSIIYMAMIVIILLKGRENEYRGTEEKPETGAPTRASLQEVSGWPRLL